MAVAGAPARDPSEGLPQAQRLRFAELRAGFVAGLPARWVQIEAAMDRAALVRGLHSLAGAAGSYGFDDLGALASAAEDAATEGDESILRAALEALRARIVPDHGPGATVR